MDFGKQSAFANVKAKPIFQRQLFLATAIFITLVIAVIFGTAFYVARSLNERVEREMASMGELVAQQVSDQIEAFNNRDPQASVVDSARTRQALQAFLDARLQNIPSLYYLILETLQGDVVAQSFKENIRPEEVSLLREGALKPRQPRSKQIELQSQANTQLRLRDLGTPIRLDARSMGQLRLGISNDYLENRVAAIRREVYDRSIVLSSITVTLFAVIFLYVRWLVKRAQGLEAQAQSADRLAYLGTLASGLAHEIRNPLSAMNLNIQMMEESYSESKAGNEEMASIFESTKREIKRLDRLASNFLMYAKPLHIEFHLLDLKELVTGVYQEIKPQLEDAGIAFEMHTEEASKLQVNGDRDLLKQALLNLLINAREAVLEKQSSDRRVEVRLYKSPPYDVVEVHDNGVGVALEQQQTIFGIFYSTKKGGTGLGLPIARHIIEHHGGHLGVESVPGHYSTFKISLPIP